MQPAWDFEDGPRWDVEDGPLLPRGPYDVEDTISHVSLDSWFGTDYFYSDNTDSTARTGSTGSCTPTLLETSSDAGGDISISSWDEGGDINISKSITRWTAPPPSLLERLFSMGMLLISVTYIEKEQARAHKPNVNTRGDPT